MNAQQVALALWLHHDEDRMRHDHNDTLSEQIAQGAACALCPEAEDRAGLVELDELDRRLLNDFQHDFPLTPAPYAELARRLGLSEDAVLARLARLRAAGAIGRIGAVLRPNTVGASTLAAMRVPAEDLERVAQLVSAYPEVNHNYEREHELNLWFVVTAADSARRDRVLEEIAARSGYEVLSFPLEEDYHIDLGFDLRWP